MPISIHGTSSTLEKTFPKQCMQELHLKLRVELFAQMHAQLAARHQAEESQEAVKDILNWSRKQKEKDRAISRAAASGKNTRSVRPSHLWRSCVGGRNDTCMFYRRSIFTKAIACKISGILAWTTIWADESKQTFL